MRSLVAIGLDSDQTFIHFLARSRMRGIEVQPVALRDVVQSGAWRLSAPDDGTSSITVNGSTVELSKCTAFYTRLIDLSWREEPHRLPRWRGLIDGLRAFLEMTGGLVINRPGAHQHNGMKPLHEAWIARSGFTVPDGVLSCDPAVLTDFASHGRTVAKAGSGVRAHAREVTTSDFGDFHRDQGPVHLQRLVVGDDVRAHVVGERVVATRIRSTALDYRRRGSKRIWWRCELPTRLTELLVAATRAMGLAFAGWDFKVDKDEQYWCLEANPMPGYTMYDIWVDGDISNALLDLMLQDSPALQPTRAMPPVSLVRLVPVLMTRAQRRPCTALPNADRCGCGAVELLRDVCSQIGAQKQIIDERLDHPAPWRGLLRREVQAYSRPGEPQRFGAAFDSLLTMAGQRRSWDEDVVKELHARAVGGAEYRDRTIVVPGAYSYPSPDVVPYLLHEMMQRISASDEPAPLRAARLHLGVLSVHPFTDGNGRTARLTASLLLLDAGFKSTLLTAVEEFFHVEPPRYVEVLDYYRYARICEDACLLELLVAMRSASSAATWYRARQRRILESIEASGVAPSEREAVRREAELLAAPRGQGARVVALMAETGDEPWWRIAPRLSSARRHALLRQLLRLKQEEVDQARQV